MTKEDKEIFYKWIQKKYPIPIIIGNEKEEEKVKEWWLNEEKEFKKYHPLAGTFIKSMNIDEITEFIKNLRK